MMGYVYLTEDRDDSVLYRFSPTISSALMRGGRLQAMKADGITDLRNWSGDSIAVGSMGRIIWIDLDVVEAPKADLRYRAAAKGASLVARG